MINNYQNNISYLVGVALGDGNLSNPNGRAVRLRITCDNKYPNIIKNIVKTIKKILPLNKVSLVKRTKNCTDISCYSNQLENLLGWKALRGSKKQQKVKVPQWIKRNKTYTINCLRGLIETDGSIYMDRGYKMVNFVTYIPTLKTDFLRMLKTIGFTYARTYKYFQKGKVRYNIRISKNVSELLSVIKAEKKNGKI